MEFKASFLKNPVLKMIYEEYVAFLDLFSVGAKQKMAGNLRCIDYHAKPGFRCVVAGGYAPAITKHSIVHDGVMIGSVGETSLSVDSNAKPNVRLHEWWHSLAAHKSPVLKRNGYYLSNGLSRVSDKEVKMAREAAKVGKKIEIEMKFGSGFEEGMAEVTSILALFKKKAKIMDGIYDERILKAADHFMNTGEMDSSILPDFCQGYFKCYADIARLFIKASRNDYMLTHDFAEVLASDEGIDGMIEEPVNKPYSTYIYSAVHGDLQFQCEYDDIYVAKSSGLLSYEQIGNMMDDWFGSLMSSGGRLNDKQKMEMQAIINSISRYNALKLESMVVLGRISDERRDELVQDFEKTADIVRRAYSVGSYGTGDTISRTRKSSFRR